MWPLCRNYEVLKVYIEMNFDGLKDKIIEMLAGGRVPVNVGKFSNDMSTFSGADDVLTLLIHLGYLGYDFDSRCAYIQRKKYADKPAMVVELKLNVKVSGAVDQIMERNYPDGLEDYKNNMLLCGISYHRKSKRHTCRICRL